MWRAKFIWAALLAGISGSVLAASELESSTAPTAASESLTFSSKLNYNDYIASKSYAKWALSDSYGKLVSESYIGEYTRDQLSQHYRSRVCRGVYWYNCENNIQQLSLETAVDLNQESQESGLVLPSISGIKAYKVSYTTLGMDNQSHPVSGAVIIPDSNRPLKGVVIFYHYTVLNKNDVPSRFARDEYNLSKTLAGGLAGAGYVVVLPDYIGLGDDHEVVHPYILYPQINALSGIYMLKLIPQLQPALHYELEHKRIPLFLSGYSEGASYALWASKLLQDNSNYLANNGFELKKTIPMEGAYNVSKVMLPSLLKNTTKDHQAPFFAENARVVAFSKPGLTANVLNSYGYYSLAQAESSVFAADFYACNGCEIDGQESDISRVLQANNSDFDKYKMLHSAAGITGYANESNSVERLGQAGILDSAEFQAQLESADIYNWRAKTPVTFLTLEYDSLVSRLNSETAYLAMSKQNSAALKITQIPNRSYKVKGYIPFTDIDVDHPQGLPFILLYARMEMAESAPNATHN